MNKLYLYLPFSWRPRFFPEPGSQSSLGVSVEALDKNKQIDDISLPDIPIIRMSNRCARAPAYLFFQGQAPRIEPVYRIPSDDQSTSLPKNCIVEIGSFLPQLFSRPHSYAYELTLQTVRPPSKSVIGWRARSPPSTNEVLRSLCIEHQEKRHLLFFLTCTFPRFLLFIQHFITFLNSRHSFYKYVLLPFLTEK